VGHDNKYIRTFLYLSSNFTTFGKSLGTRQVAEELGSCMDTGETASTIVKTMYNTVIVRGLATSVYAS